MSDEHKPHDDHGHDHGHAPAHDDHAAAPAGDHGHAAEPAHADDHGHAAEAPVHHDDHAAEAHGDHGHDDHAHAAEAPAHHDDHGHAAEAHVDHVEAAHTDDGHGDHHDDHGHAAHDDHSHAADHSHDGPHLTPAEATAAAAIAGGATVAASHGEKRPVWSDSGDAPFEDVDATPVYARGGKKGKGKSGGGNELWEIVKTIAFALLIALVLRTLLFQPFTIPSASMEPNLYEGDYIVVSKWSYGYSRHSLPLSPKIFNGRIFAQTPHRGDIVVFKLPRDDGHGPNTTDYIKRLIGLPGDKIQMISNVLYINGQPVRDVVMSREDVAGMYQGPVIHSRETFPDGSKTFNVQDWGPNNALDDTPVFEVPPGYYFMMGDNRDNSIDSRVDQSSGVGFVPAENLIGKAQMILFSWSPGVNKNPVTWFTKLRPSRFFTVLD